jgi:hypothetical protein
MPEMQVSATPVVASTVGGSGVVTGPTAGQVIATVTPTVSGLYDVEVFIGMNATLASAVDSNNMNLKVGSTTVITNIPYVGTGTSNSTTGPVKIRAVLDGATAVTVNAVGAATGTGRYAASITATRVG